MGLMERHAGSQRPAITNNRVDRHLTSMALGDRTAASPAFGQEMYHL